MNSFHYLPAITMPTRSTSLLDHIWINRLTSFSSGIIKEQITDHYPVFIRLLFKDTNTACQDKVKISFRCNNDSACREILNERVRDFDWNSVKTTDPSTFTENFISVVNKLYRKSFPLKIKYVSPKQFQNPWYNDSVRKLISAKSQYFFLYRSGFVTQAENNIFKNKVKKLLNKWKKAFYDSLFHTYRSDMRKTWMIINSLIGKNSVKPPISLLSDDNVDISDPSEIAHIFNRYFGKIAHDLEDSLPHNDLDPCNFIDFNIPNLFTFEPTTQEEIHSIIKEMKPSKQDKDSIPIKIFISFAHYFSLILCDLINLCFSTGVFPACLKLAVIIPILKQGDPTIYTNFRPISLLIFISKIIEKCMYNRMYNYFHSNSIFSSSQFGFLRGLSTAHALSHLTEFLYNAIDDREVVVNVFIDFRKAFDTINHDILIKKLERYGIQGLPLALIKNYLSDRFQCVRIGDKISSKSKVTLGVPQGSNLGPLLFLIYVNDIANISNSIFTTLFADDTTVSFKFKSTDNFESLCNHQLNLLYQWTICNRLSLNADKTYFNIITKKVLPRGFYPFNLHINGEFISYKNKEKFLGVVFDDQLKFNFHAEVTARKISKSIGIMYRLRDLVPASSLITLYYSFIYPYLSYCNIIWGGTYQCHLNPLLILQKRAIRIIHHANYLDHTDELFFNSKILKINDIHKYAVALHMFKLENFDAFDRNHNYSTRNVSALLPAFNRLTLTQHSISYMGPTVWNSIPHEIRNLPGLNSFKRALKLYLISSYGSQ